MSIRIRRLGFYDKDIRLSFFGFRFSACFDLSNDWELDMDLLRLFVLLLGWVRLGWAGSDDRYRRRDR